MEQKEVLTPEYTTDKYKIIPLEMAAVPHWGLWRKEPKPDGKIDKIPCNTAGYNIAHQSFYQTLEEAAKEFNPAIHAGLGLSFREDDTFYGYDTDDTLNDAGELTDPVILAEVEAQNTYTEVSQSGGGLHCIGMVEWPEDLKQGTNRKTGELYYSGRFFAMTGIVWKGSPTEIRMVEPVLIRRIYDRLNPPEETPARPPQTAQATHNATMSDFEIITRLRDSSRTKALWGGDTSAHKGDDSSADLALCNEICFYTKDSYQIDSVFRRSGLYRSKWDEKRGETTYGGLTINKVIQTKTDHYDPYYSPPAPAVDISGILNSATPTQPDGEIINADDLISGYQTKKHKLNLSILPSESLVSRYVEHMGKRSDSYPEYQYTGALFAISTLIRRKAFIKFRHGTIYPNLWCMNLGASTVSRKSTAVKSVSNLMSDVMAGETSLIDIRGPRKSEDSFSPEAFIESMAENPVQYLILDECGQLLADMKKQYMANMRDLFCRIFDNTNYERRLRSKKTQDDKSQFVIEDPYFTTLMATTPDTMAHHTDLLDLSSGWLLRYIYTMPEYPKEFKPFERDDVILESEYSGLVEDFKKIRMIFEQHTVEFWLSDNALKLYQDWQRTMETTLAAEGDEIKLSAFGRLVDAVVKMAIIHTVATPAFMEADHSESDPYIIHTREMQISIDHISEYFLPVFVEVADIVNRCDSKNLQDKIIGYMKRKGGKCTRSALLKYIHKKASELNPELNTLIESEEIQHAEAKGNAGRVERWYILN